jgi:hypothetical protein
VILLYASLSVLTPPLLHYCRRPALLHSPPQPMVCEVAYRRLKARRVAISSRGALLLSEGVALCGRGAVLLMGEGGGTLIEGRRSTEGGDSALIKVIQPLDTLSYWFDPCDWDDWRSYRVGVVRKFIEKGRVGRVYNMRMVSPVM